MQHIIAESSFDTPLSEEEEKRTSKIIDQSLLHANTHWVRSFISQDRMRIVSEFEGTDLAAVETAYQEAGLDLDLIWQAQVQTAEAVKAD